MQAHHHQTTQRIEPLLNAFKFMSSNLYSTQANPLCLCRKLILKHTFYIKVTEPGLEFRSYGPMKVL